MRISNQPSESAVSCPPKSQRFPFESVALAQRCRAPGTLAELGCPSVPYTPGWLIELLPFIQVHWFVAGSYIHKSLKNPINTNRFHIFCSKTAIPFLLGRKDENQNCAHLDPMMKHIHFLRITKTSLLKSMTLQIFELRVRWRMMQSPLFHRSQLHSQ